MLKFLLITFIFLFINACTVLIPFLIPLSNLPVPSGLNNVGTKILEWEDSSRKEWFTSNSEDFRKLVLQVWYPTDDSLGKIAQYLDHPEIRLKPIAKTIELPEKLIQHIQYIETNSFVNANIKADNIQYPLILFSHGLGGMRMQNTIQMEELASYGYVVVSVDHAYDANITIFSDGSIADFRSGLRDDATEEEFWKVRLPQLNTRSKDLIFIIDQITNEISNGDSFWEMVDIDKIGLIGHSYGGATAIVTSFNDNRIDACINLDGWIEPIKTEILKEGLDIPYLYIGQLSWKDTPLNDLKLDSLILSSRGLKELIPGTKHFDYSDTPQFTSISKKFGISGSIDMDLLRKRINTIMITFFDKNVKLENN